MKAGSMRNEEFEAGPINTIKDALKLAENIIDCMTTFEDKKEYSVKIIRELKHEQKHIKKKLIKEAMLCIK